jgi:hypothetical protein
MKIHHSYINNKENWCLFRSCNNDEIWIDIIGADGLDDDFLNNFSDKINYWEYISVHRHLSHEFIRKFQDKVSWINISCRQNLSEEFIREFQDKVDWMYISLYQKLTESFIREFKDKVSWLSIRFNQELSDEFEKEFENKLK